MLCAVPAAVPAAVIAGVPAAVPAAVAVAVIRRAVPQCAVLSLQHAMLCRAVALPCWAKTRLGHLLPSGKVNRVLSVSSR